MEYQIVFGHSCEGIAEMVQKYLAEGWRLQGGVCVHASGYYQAMTR